MNFMNYPEKCLSQNAGQLPDSEFHACRTKITRSSIVVIIPVMFSLIFQQLKWHPAQDSVVDVTVTFWREKNSSSTRENLKLRRESKHVMPLFKIKKNSSNCVFYLFVYRKQQNQIKMHKTLKKRWRMIKLEVNPNFRLKIIDLVIHVQVVNCQVVSGHVEFQFINIHVLLLFFPLLSFQAIIHHGE